MAEPPADPPDPPDSVGPIGESTPAELPYQSLYRRFRPQRFADVRGQDHVTRALINSVRDGRIAHAYLFSGPRGTGKTSTARILAMALNCANPVDGEPDGTCPSCVDIRKGSSTDVQELDAASNRRIDEMRDLLSRVALGIRGRWKVYIIDEVHQLTGDAASVLLKTLEGPPPHVVFVLATTDPQKVLPTIRSRTIHFDFHLLPSDVLGDLLRDINTEAHLGVPPEAIDLVVRRGHGSARDALTVLDQVAAGGGVEDQAQMVAQIVDGLAERDTGLVLTAVAEAVAAGRDARRLAADLLEHLRNGFLATMARGLVMLPDDAVTELAEQARRLGLAALVRAMEVIGQALADMRDSVDPRVTLEVALVRLSRPDADISPAALLERIERLERAAREAASGGTEVRPTAPASAMQRRRFRRRRRPQHPARRLGPRRRRRQRHPARRLGPRRRRRRRRRQRHPARRLGPRLHRLFPGRPAGPRLLRRHRRRRRLHRRRPRSRRRRRSGREGLPPRLLPARHRRAPAAPPNRPVPASPASPAATAAPAAGSAPRPALPSRDELSKAWGDGVLRNLTIKAKAYLANGRFVAVDADGAVFALPSQQLLGRSLDARAEAEAALAARFGRPVPLKLVVEAPDPPAPDVPPDPEVPSDYEDMDYLQDAEVAVISPQQRLLDAFPGAEEVSP